MQLARVGSVRSLYVCAGRACNGSDLMRSGPAWSAVLTSGPPLLMLVQLVTTSPPPSSSATSHHKTMMHDVQIHVFVLSSAFVQTLLLFPVVFSTMVAVCVFGLNCADSLVEMSSA